MNNRIREYQKDVMVLTEPCHQTESLPFSLEDLEVRKVLTRLEELQRELPLEKRMVLTQLREQLRKDLQIFSEKMKIWNGLVTQLSYAPKAAVRDETGKLLAISTCGNPSRMMVCHCAWSCPTTQTFYMPERP